MPVFISPGKPGYSLDSAFAQGCTIPNMGKVIQGPLVSQTTGKVGGVIFHRTIGGDTVRGIYTVDNTFTDYRLLAQARQRAAQLAWQNKLNDTQRLAWDILARQVGIDSRSAIPGELTGHDCFARCYLNGTWFTYAQILDPPPDLQVPVSPVPTLTLDPAAQTMNLTFSPSPVPAGVSYSIQTTPNLSPGIMKPGDRFRPLCTLRAGETSPVNLATLFAYRWPTIAAGQKVFLIMQPFYLYNNWPGSKLSCYAAASSGGTLTVIYEGARVYLSGNQSIPTGVTTPISFDLASYNVGPMWVLATHPTRLTAVRGGTYSIKGNAAWQTDPTGSRALQIRLNGTTTIASVLNHASASGADHQAIGVHYKLQPGDYAELLAYQDTAGDENILGIVAYSPQFSAQWRSD